MYESRFSLLYKIPIVLVVLILAAELMLLSLHLAAENGKVANANWAGNFSSNPHLIYNRIGLKSKQLGTDIQHGTASVGHAIFTGFHAASRVPVAVGNGFLAVARVPVDIAHFTARATDVKAFIQPSTAVQVPIISPVPDPPAAKVAQINSPAPPTTPAKASPKPVSQKPAQHATSVKPAAIATPAQISFANHYAWGNCTWWAAFRRAQTGDPIPGNWGNAAAWADQAASDGYVVNHQPSAGAIMQTADSAGGLGHVAFVESVDSDGTWHISEMNVIGLDQVDHKAEPASAAANYNFIHDKQ